LFESVSFSLKHFGRLSPVFFNLYFQRFWPKWLIFLSFGKHFGPWPKKNRLESESCSRKIPNKTQTFVSNCKNR